MLRTGIALSVVAILNLVVFVPAANADGIPSKIVSEEEKSARDIVTNRLVELGVKADDARSKVAQLPDQVVERYANSPESIRMVSGLYFEEWLIGLAGIGVLLVIAWGIQSDISD